MITLYLNECRKLDCFLTALKCHVISLHTTDKIDLPVERYLPSKLKIDWNSVSPKSMQSDHVPAQVTVS